MREDREDDGGVEGVEQLIHAQPQARDGAAGCHTRVMAEELRRGGRMMIRNNSEGIRDSEEI